MLAVVPLWAGGHSGAGSANHKKRKRRLHGFDDFAQAQLLSRRLLARQWGHAVWVRGQPRCRPIADFSPPAKVQQMPRSQLAPRNLHEVLQVIVLPFMQALQTCAHWSIFLAS
jgi:hypothetical protein